MINMVLVAGDKFLRGSNESPDEQPQIETSLTPFFMDCRPVTNSDFLLFIEDGGYSNPEYWLPEGFEFINELEIQHPLYWKDTNWNLPDHPVTGVSWFEADAYARFQGKKLPTEAQWEFAAKGNDNRRYPWGNTEPSALFTTFAPDCEPEDLVRKSTPWHAHPQNRSPFGCIDMAGNLSEWCRDNYFPNYSWDKIGIDPLFLSNISDDHVTRGGSGLHDENYLRCTSRDSYPPTVRDNIVGFRCIREIAPEI
jgi:formylglycine-generating enzyme required for sulfatase activity